MQDRRGERVWLESVMTQGVKVGVGGKGKWQGWVFSENAISIFEAEVCYNPYFAMAPYANFGATPIHAEKTTHYFELPEPFI